jgi:hypothetical protein
MVLALPLVTMVRLAIEKKPEEHYDETHYVASRLIQPFHIDVVHRTMPRARQNRARTTQPHHDTPRAPRPNVRITTEKRMGAHRHAFAKRMGLPPAMLM